MKDAILILAAVVAFSLPYSRMPHTWRAFFTTAWWRRR